MAYQSQDDDEQERPPLNGDYIVRHLDGSWEMDVQRLFTDAFQGHDTLTGAALRYAVMTLGHIASRSLYIKCLDKAKSLDMLLRSHDNQNHVVYRLKSAPPAKPVAEQIEIW